MAQNVMLLVWHQWHEYTLAVIVTASWHQVFIRFLGYFKARTTSFFWW